MAQKRAWLILCMYILGGQRDYILILFLRVWMIIKKTMIVFPKKKFPKIDNAIWHIHEGNIPNSVYPIEFSPLINLVTALNTSDTETIYNFCLLYTKKDLRNQEKNELKKIIKLAINYFQNFILPKLKKRSPKQNEKIAIVSLIKEINSHKSELDAEEYQKLIYKYGKVYPENLRSWFISLYQILFGSENGPRLGSLFYLYKKEKVLKILEKLFNRQVI